MPVFKILFIMAVLAFFLVWIRIEINRSGRTIGVLQSEVDIKEARNQYLKLENLRLSSPEKIFQPAQENFGFTPIHPTRVIILDK